MSVVDSHYPPELLFFIVATGGFLFGELFKRVKLPDVTGQILFGLIIGPTGAVLLSHILGREFAPMFSQEAFHSISFFSEFALGVMVFIVGSHLTKRALHNAGSRIVYLALSQTVVVFVSIFVSLIFIAKMDIIPAALLGAVAIAVAPGTVISVIQTKNARGGFTKTLLGVVAISNVTTILLFDVINSISIAYLDRTESAPIALTVLFSIIKPLFTILAGVISGLVVHKITTHNHHRNSITAIIVLAILGNIVIGRAIGLSPILINLVMGITYSNRSYHLKVVDQFFGELEGILYSLFFVLAGAHLNIESLKMAGVAGVIFIVVRFIAQYLNAYIVSRLKGYGDSIGKYLGIAMLPKAGLAIGLLVVLTSESELASSAQLFTAVILASVVVNELIGPFAVAYSLDRAGDTNQAQPRLVDFLHEEYILSPLKADNKWDAIEQMCDFLIKSNNLAAISSEELKEMVIAREKDFPTAIGEQIAVPHARIPGNHKLMGVIGILEKPIEFEALDNRPVDVVILVATPEGKDTLHIKLLATIARIFSNPSLHRAIVTSQSAAEVYDILQSEEIRTINTYLNEDV